MNIIDKEIIEILDLTEFQKEELGLLGSNPEIKLNEEILDDWWVEGVLGG